MIERILSCSLPLPVWKAGMIQTDGDSWYHYESIGSVLFNWVGCNNGGVSVRVSGLNT